MNTVETVLTKAETRDTQRGPIYLVKDQGGKEYSTFREGVWAVAKSMLGAKVQLTYTSKQSDKYGENRYLEAVELVEAAPTTFLEAVENIDDSIPFTEEPDETEKRIARSVALKAVATSMPPLPVNIRTPAGVIAVADIFTEWLLTGECSRDFAGE